MSSSGCSLCVSTTILADKNRTIYKQASILSKVIRLLTLPLGLCNATKKPSTIRMIIAKGVIYLCYEKTYSFATLIDQFLNVYL